MYQNLGKNMEIGYRRSLPQVVEKHIVFLAVVDSNLWRHAILGESCERRLCKGVLLGCPITLWLRIKNIKIESNDLSSSS